MCGEKMIGEDAQLQAVWFAAGTAALIACIERAVVVSLFAQWRVWAFLALNLLLLAILFTSSKPYKPSKPSSNNQIDDVAEDSKVLDTKKVIIEEHFCSHPLVSDAGEIKNRVDEIEKVNGGDDSDDQQLSKEELNRRAEAFIAMFRQHLVSDAKGKSFDLQFPTTNGGTPGISRRLNTSIST
ncbi:hypothetical protein ABFS82_11G126200 [Erythranthe guttata]|uniref:DUF4408 domain-containing protein n=1 Tax=Erythranthe guttata TaxID=4155 RepID=A0A022R3Z0_ERYGU|nr:PREDICTED: uncharacterized protein LOC105960863 [Erythranthe guttata]EYU34689.1 hypothetical protein MIMGU_mgv1a014665mg [Erythranthe guttata]|eukprot:XP_012840527.1 PREDICTED: uncharacterized protein LOC105960863 [Erythranthe guttata]